MADKPDPQRLSVDGEIVATFLSEEELDAYVQFLMDYRETPGMPRTFQLRTGTILGMLPDSRKVIFNS
tara:strand:- start:416 stop:619 length:204 start_codon:yes stop_codon:yes gene_type:complete